MSTTTVTRRAFRYYGGKSRLAPWIIENLPKHRHYVEPCGGAASVLLQKPRSEIETYNDLNGELVNFFRVLRDRTDELLHAIEWTPWAREEYHLSKHPTDDSLEAARRWWVFCSMDVGAQPALKRPNGHDSFRRDKETSRNTLENRWRPKILENLRACATRLRDVIIEQRPMLDVVQQLDTDSTCFYIDPPYVAETRAKGTDGYSVEWSDDDHRQFIDVIQSIKGSCVISGYACKLYEPLEKAGWSRVDRQAVNNSGDTRIESLWLCPKRQGAAAGKLF